MSGLHILTSSAKYAIPVLAARDASYSMCAWVYVLLCGRWSGVDEALENSTHLALQIFHFSPAFALAFSIGYKTRPNSGAIISIPGGMLCR